MKTIRKIYTFYIISLLSATCLFPISGKSQSRDYLHKQLSNLYVNAKYEIGTMYTNTDTIEAEMMIFNRKQKSLKYEYCVFKSKEGKIRFFTASELTGYKLKKEVFKKHASGKDTFFIKELEIGRIQLYKREKIPSSQKQTYYIKLPVNDFYFTFCPDDEYFDFNNENSMKYIQTSKDGATKMYHVESSINDRFKVFIGGYLGDCLKVKNLVKADMYTIHDIEDIVKEYNKCF